MRSFRRDAQRNAQPKRSNRRRSMSTAVSRTLESLGACSMTPRPSAPTKTTITCDFGLTPLAASSTSSRESSWRSDDAGLPVALLPLAIRRRLGLRVAEFACGRESNLNLALVRPGAPPLDFRALLIAAARISPDDRGRLFPAQSAASIWRAGESARFFRRPPQSQRRLWRFAPLLSRRPPLPAERQESKLPSAALGRARPSRLRTCGDGTATPRDRRDALRAKNRASFAPRRARTPIRPARCGAFSTLSPKESCSKRMR